ncbi:MULTISPECIES: hypothetical protein [unclassified Streptomyces]|uniref:hypothetical protein n=1 Tax=unclassified Streptomyces TaxID=2593676 RepID=UPI001FB344A5|nr:hypothetical protein [Streptomyces sp. APSN-46.1]MCJ1678485.1 hypothetical protein [Streptomyces sp. APSN-46.1]
MSDEELWRWEYDPDAEHVISGLPQHVIHEVERLSGELVALAEVGVDISDIGAGPSHGGPGGLRRIPLLTDGWFYALPVPRMKLIAIIRVIPPFADL